MSSANIVAECMIYTESEKLLIQENMGAVPLVYREGTDGQRPALFREAGEATYEQPRASTENVLLPLDDR